MKIGNKIKIMWVYSAANIPKLKTGMVGEIVNLNSFEMAVKFKNQEGLQWFQIDNNENGLYKYELIRNDNLKCLLNETSKNR